MKFIKYKWFSFLMILAVVSVSCSKFEEMNYNPNKPVNVPTSGILTQAQANLVYNFNGELAQLGEQYAQHLTQIDYTEKSNYLDAGISSFTGIYRAGLKDLKEIISINQNEVLKEEAARYGDNENQIAVAKILIAWAFHNMTDVWGDIPYSEALNDDFILPKYDTQASIYNDLYKELNDAIAMIKTSPVVGLQGDLIYDGDMAMWSKFAESLKLRIAMRLSEVDDTKANGWINDADFAKAFTSGSSDYARFQHLSTDGEANPLYMDNVVYAGADNYAVANTLIDAMQANADPRVAKYAELASNSSTYVGLTYGVGGNDDDISLPGDMYASQSAPSIMMTAAEVLFIKAEAAQRSYISGDAATFYKAAITASMEYNGVASAAIVTYLALPAVQYDAANWEKSIGTQKWLALYGVGIQAWAEQRRLDQPVLALPTAATITQIPTRRAYTSDEYSTNNANVTAAVASQFSGKDLFTGKLWWDK